MKRVSARRFAIRAILVLFVLEAAVSSSRSQWQRSSGPAGGQISAIVTDADTLYAAAGPTFATGIGAFGDVYRSTDLGEHWTSIATSAIYGNPVYELAITSRAIYAGTLNGLYRKYKGSTTWDSISAEPKYFRATHVLASDTDLIVFSDFNGLYRSRDDGRTWTKLSVSGIGGTAVNALDRIGSTLFVATQGKGVFRSPDNGVTWGTVNSGLGGDDLYAYALTHIGSSVMVGTLRGAFASTNFGDTWDTVRTGIPQSFGPISFAKTSTALYAAVYGGGIYRFNIASASWELLNNGLGEFPTTSVVAATDNWVFTSTNLLGVFRTDKTTINWQPKTYGINHLSVFGLRVLSPAGHPTLFAGTLDADFGLAYRSTDHAMNWTTTDSISVMGIIDFTEHNGRLFAGTSGNGVFVSDLAGQHWKPATMQIGAASYISNMLSTPHAVFAGVSGSAGLLRTTDDGQTWTTPLESASTSVTRLFNDTVSKQLFAGSSFGIFVSSDEGETWSRPKTAIDSMQIEDFARVGNTLLAATRFGLYASNDNGLTWALADAATARKEFFALLGIGDTVLAAVKGDVLVSGDHGNSWRSYQSGLPPTADMASLVSDGEYIYVGTVGYGVWSVRLPSASAVTQAPANSKSLQVIYGEGSTRIAFDLVSESSVTLSMNDVGGRSLFTAPLGHLPAGHHSIELPKLPCGAYVAVLRSNDTERTAKVLLSR